MIGAAPTEANPGPAAGLSRPPRRDRAAGGGAGGGAGDTLVSPIQGSVLKVAVSEGDEVAEGALICIVEAMKMENEITSHREGLVTGLTVAAGESVKSGQVVCVIAQDGASEDDPGVP